MLLALALLIVLATGVGALIWPDTLAVGAFAIAVMLLIAIVLEQWGTVVIEVICLMTLACYGLLAPEVQA